MNVSITDQLAEYVRDKVKSGRYNNASEVVRDALRRMEQEDARALRLAEPSIDDIVSDLDATQLDSIRRRVEAGAREIDEGKFQSFEGRAGLVQLANKIKHQGRERLQRESSRD